MERQIRILIVEDDPIVGLDLSEQVADAGFVVIGPAMTSGGALELLRSEGCDLGVLDVNLGPETSEAVAIEMNWREIPFITLSGYSRDQHPPAFRNAPFMIKPVRVERLISRLRDLLGDQADRSSRPG